jgi:hypothetical protein
MTVLFVEALITVLYVHVMVVALIVPVVGLIIIGDNFLSGIITLWTGSAMWCRGGVLGAH